MSENKNYEAVFELSEQPVLEVNFDLASQPVDINLELKTYQEKDSNYIVLDFEKSDWVLPEEKNQYHLKLNFEDYDFTHFATLNFFLYDEDEQAYLSALCDYEITDKGWVFYSDRPHKCRLILFGLIKNA